MNFHHLKNHDDQLWPWHQSCLPWHQLQEDHQIPTKKPKPQLLILWFFSTIPLVRKGLMGGRFCKYQTHLLKWTCFSNNNNNKKSSEQSKAYYTLPAILIRSQLKLLPFFTFSTIKRGKLRYRPNISTHTVQTLKQKLAFSCNIFRLFALLLTKTCLRSHGHVHDCDHLLDGDAHDMLKTFSEFPDGSHQP